MIAYPRTNRFIFTLTLCISFIFCACTKVDVSDGDRVQERIDVQDFDKIYFELGGELNYTQGDLTQVTLTSGQSAIEAIDIFVEDDILYIKRKKGYTIKSQDELVFDIVDDDTYEIYVCGSGDVKADFDENYHFDEHILRVSGSGNITADAVYANNQHAKCSGSGDITIDFVSANSVESKIHGSGSILISSIYSAQSDNKISGSGSICYGSGEVNESEIDISGSGDYHTYHVFTSSSAIKTCGSGDGFLRANNKLDANLSGSGDVFYKGYPVLIATSSGSGDIYDAN